MDAFQREVIDRLARIETKAEAFSGLVDRVTALEKGESRRNAIVGAMVGLPALLTAAWAIFRGTSA